LLGIVGSVTPRSREPQAAADFGADDRRGRHSPRARLGWRARDVVGVVEAFGRAPVAAKLRFDPVDGPAVAVGALLAITELRQALDGRLVSLQIEPSDQHFRRVAGRILRGCSAGTLAESGRREHDGQAANRKDETVRTHFVSPAGLC